MNARLEPCVLTRKAERLNGWNEEEAEWQEAGTVRAAISAGTGGGLMTVNELLRIESTHTAVTWDDVRVGDRIRATDDDGSGTGWEVVYRIDGGRRRMHQLFLKRVDEVNRA